jgi:GntR family transcriptional regulator
MRNSPLSELQAGASPLYQQLAMRLRRQISDGVFQPGDRLPSEEALCVQFGVSRITVRAALDQLVDDSLLWRKRGKGTFVSSRPVQHELIHLTDFVEDMAKAGLSPSSRVTFWGEEPASEEVSSALELSPGTPIVRLDRLRIADRAPIAFDVTYLPLRYGRLLDRQRLETETIYHQLETQYGIPVVSGTFVITASRASAEMATSLAVERGSPLLVINRTSYGESRDPIYYQIRTYRADRVQYRVELSRTFPDQRTQLTEFTPVFESGE